MRFLAFVAFGFASLVGVRGASASADPLPVPAERWRHEQWPAHWITAPDAPANDYGVYLFRKSLSFVHRPERFVVHVTADARYRLFVNGKSVSFGPQRSDRWVWRYDTLDLAPWLRDGENVVAVQVWSYGVFAPYAIVGERTGLLIQGDTEAGAGQAVNTDASWKVVRDEAYTPLPVKLPTYIVVGPGDHVNGAAHPWGWQTVGFDDHAWRAPRLRDRGNPYGRGTDLDHWLAPRTIPPMEESPTRFAKVRRAEGVHVPDGFVRGKSPLIVPAHARASVLLDNGAETNAFPQLVVSDGNGAKVKLTYAEALIDAAGNKGNRDEIDGRHIVGVVDEFLPDGGERRRFTTLAFRTYRYVQLDVETADAPLRIEDVSGVFTGYPFEERGKFSSDDPSLAKIWETGWRTARLCAGETYFDCPYYEQLQYVGDTRLQALISLYVAGDDRLMRNAIELYDRSRIAEGLTQSRYPSAVPQVINTFSLFWIEMVRDYWMHRPDEGFVRERLPGIEAVLGWFERRIDAQTGLLGSLDYWTFVDWTDQWPWSDALGIGGEPPGAREGGSSIVSLQLAGTLDHATEIFRAFGREERAARCEKQAAALRAAVIQRCWDESRRLVADTPAKTSFSQHANALAVLSGAIGGEAAADLMRRVVADKSLVQCSTYFRFYLLRAMKQTGLGDDYLAQLGPWRAMLDRGLTTFAEKPDPTRSDCHAWSATPVYELLATVCGIEPASPGFSTVRIEPHLGPLRRAEGIVPHPRGEIRVTLVRRGESLLAEVALPTGVTGSFVWHGKVVPLHEGGQKLSFGD
jgi:alpha-L-rhamnosidase